MKNSANINNIFNTVNNVYRRNFWPILGYTVLLQFIIAIISYGLNMLLYFIALAITTPMILLDNSIFSVGAMALTFLIILIITMMLKQLIKVGHIKAVIDAKEGTKVSFDGMFSYTFSRAKYALSSSFIYALFISLMYIIGIIFICGINYFMLLDQSFWIIVTGNIIIGITLLVIFLWFLVKTFYYLPIAVMEKKHFIAPIIDSFGMAKKTNRVIVGYIGSLFLAALVITGGLTGSMSVISGVVIAGVSNINPALMAIIIALLYLLFIVIIFITSIIVTPIQYLFIATTYFEERDRRFGDDLFNRLEGLILDQKEALKMEISHYGDTTNI